MKIDNEYLISVTCAFQHNIKDTEFAYELLQIYNILENFHFGTTVNIFAAKKQDLFNIRS